MSDALLYRKIGRALHPADDAAAEEFARIPNGATVRATVRLSRNSRHHRLFFALMQRVHRTLPETTAHLFPRVGDLVDEIKIATGHFDMVTRPNGETYPRPRSIAYDKMNQIEFSQFFDAVVAVIVSSILPAVPEGQLRAEIEEMTAPRFAA